MTGVASVSVAADALAPGVLFGVRSPLTALTLVCLVGAVVAVAGTDQVARALRNSVRTIRPALPHFLLLGAILVVNSVLREIGPEISWIIGWNITDEIHAIEGAFVPTVQSIATPWLTAYFSVAYVYGYTFLLLFPFLAYFALEDVDGLRRTALAYGVNYLLGLVGYVLFISYGPRNLMPGTVDALLYATYPHSHVLTSMVNTNTNVFPSLHTSLSVTAVLSLRSAHERSRRLVAVTAPLAASIVVATVYLGIHWGIDVLAGLLLAVASVGIARRVQEWDRN